MVRDMKFFCWVIISLILVGLCVGGVSASDMKEGKIEKASTEIIMDKGAVSFTDKNTGLSASTTTTINGVKFTPSKTTEGKDLTWSTGEADPIVKMVYSYDGKTLKEIITLKEDKVLTFPITLSTYSKLIPWDNGQWKIVATNSFETMKGIVLEKPYGIDANGKRIEMEYTYEKGVLTLVYDRTITEWVAKEKIVIDNKTGGETTEIAWVPKYSAITYPLVIDPTWVVFGDHYRSYYSAYTLEKWETTGTTTWTVPANITSVDAFVVAGGGGGGSTGDVPYRSLGSGGGGAGGMIEKTSITVTPGQIINLTVGAGGDYDTNNAKPSVFNNRTLTNITAIGGGNSIMSDPFAYIDYTAATPVIKFNQFGTLPTGYTAVLNISGTYEVA